MRYALLTLFLVGCGESSLPTDGTTNWSVTLGAWEAPVCQGLMSLSPSHVAEPRGMPPAFVGTWKCGGYGGQASGDVRSDGRVFLSLETTPGFLNGVRGTLADDNAIAGDILLNYVVTPFSAYRQ